jgi:glycosyltransferase involved in cell wall biosynthesis
MRATDCPDFAAPPSRLGRNVGQFTVAFAGTINSNGYIQALREVQHALEPLHGRLLIFGPLSVSQARQVGLDHSNTVVCGLLTANELMARLRDEADALFVPMSFDPADRTNMELAFPSKLADCTAVGLPLLIYGPTYCSAVVWARENAGVAEIVTTDQGPDLSDVVRRLQTNPGLRVALGKRALEVGKQYFAHEAVKQVFDRALGVN